MLRSQTSSFRVSVIEPGAPGGGPGPKESVEAMGLMPAGSGPNRAIPDHRDATLEPSTMGARA